MDEQLNENGLDQPQSTSTGGKTPLLLFGLALLAIGVMFVLYKNRDKETTTLGVTVTPEIAVENSPAAVIGNVRTFEINSGMFYFDPKEIRVKEGETVRIVLKNTEGTHDFVLDEFNVRTKIVNGVGSDEVTFIASQKGEFEYYCSVGEHRSLGMVGKLIVE
jgi:cytochrome c oxidase subunit 2